jgi:hypothetical protein
MLDQLWLFFYLTLLGHDEGNHFFLFHSRLASAKEETAAFLIVPPSPRAARFQAALASFSTAIGPYVEICRVWYVDPAGLKI